MPWSRYSSTMSQGNSCVASISAARGAMRSRASVRTSSRSSRCSSLRTSQGTPGFYEPVGVRAGTQALGPRAASQATPSGICPAGGGDQAAGIRLADSCLASKPQPASDSAGTNLLTSTILSAGTFARRAAATIASGDGAS